MGPFEPQPKVSVCVITYNQERYIRQCLQSTVEQKTDFPFEIIVGDDCSTDCTRQIVQEFAGNYPGVVKPILHEQHVGGTMNYLSVHRSAGGKYVAHLDGDDYMLPGKLQTQADALDANQDCAICVHEVRRLDDRNNRFLHPRRKALPRKSDVRYLLMNLPFFAHSSKMYRSECNRGLETLTGEILDCYFHVHHALAGSILYLSAPLGVYRLNVGHSTDPTDTRDTLYKAPALGLAELYVAALEHAKDAGVESSLIAKAKAKVLFDYSYTVLMAKQFTTFHSYISQSLDAARINKMQAIFGFFAAAPRLLFWLLRLRASVRGSLLALWN